MHIMDIPRRPRKITLQINLNAKEEANNNRKLMKLKNALSDTKKIYKR